MTVDHNDGNMNERNNEGVTRSNNPKSPAVSNRSNNNNNNRSLTMSHNKSTSTVAADAEFIQQQQQFQQQGSSLSDLQRSSVLRLQTQDLLEKVMLTNSIDNASSNKRFVKHVQSFLQQLQEQVEGLSLSDVKHDDSSPLDPYLEAYYNCMNTFKAKAVDKSIVTMSLTSTNKLEFVMPSMFSTSYTSTKTCNGSDALPIVVDLAHSSLTNATGNASNVPTVQVWIRMPNDVFKEKDYSNNHRYFYKRNRIVWLVAKHLSTLCSCDDNKSNNSDAVNAEKGGKKKNSKQKAVANATKPTLFIEQVYWFHHRNDFRRPCLLVVPSSDTLNAKKKSLTFNVMLQFGMQSLDWIPIPRLWPNRNNLPTNLITKLQKNNASEKNNSKLVVESDFIRGDNHSMVGSPAYNHDLLMDGICLENGNIAAALHGGGSSNSSDASTVLYQQQIAQTATLVKIWCLQRGLWNAHDGIDAVQASCWIIYLYRCKLVSPRLGPLPTLTALLKLWSEMNWLGENDKSSTNKSIFTQKDDSNDAVLADANKIRKAPSEGYAASYYQLHGKRDVLIMPLEGYTVSQTIDVSLVAQKYAQVHNNESLVDLYAKQYTHAPVLLDPTLTYNIIGSWSPAFVRTLQRQAHQTLQVWHGPSAGPCVNLFRHLFLSPARFWESCDAHIDIKLIEVDFIKLQSMISMLRKENTAVAFADMGPCEFLVRSVVSLLRCSLSDRVLDMRVLTTGNDRTVNSKNTQNKRIEHQNLHKIVKEKSNKHSNINILSPIGHNRLVIGLTLCTNNSLRVVDRGPPAEDKDAVFLFKTLWGEKAELRRFKDGAIIHAAVWNEVKDTQNDDMATVKYANEDKFQGGIVEQIVQHTLESHVIKGPASSFVLRDVLSCVDSAYEESTKKSDISFYNPITAHRMLSKAFERLSEFLQKHSAPVQNSGTAYTGNQKQSSIGLPLPIDAVEPLSRALRFAELFPPMPHPLLGGLKIPGALKVTGAVQYNPVLVQLRFSASTKWPSDFRAIAAAKTAMLVQLADGIEAMKSMNIEDAKAFSGDVLVTADYAEVAFMGYVFRIIVRADAELKILQNLVTPNTEAITLFDSLYERHVLLVMHHSMMHAIHTSYATSTAVVRLLKRWLACHMLSGLIPCEALDLIVAYVYTDRTLPIQAPGTLVAGFMRSLYLIATHPWSLEPLIVDPTHQLSEDDTSKVQSNFDQLRGTDYSDGPPMYIVAPYNNPSERKNTLVSWTPLLSLRKIEWVVLMRVVAIAQKSYDFLYSCLTVHTSDNSWYAAFRETDSAFRSFSCLLRVDESLAIDTTSSSTYELMSTKENHSIDTIYTQSMRHLYVGPKNLQRKMYRNLSAGVVSSGIMLHWKPVDEVVETLRKKLGSRMLLFYNELCPQVVGLLWRPTAIDNPTAFSAISSEYACPVRSDQWKVDTMVVTNIHDVMREIQQHCNGVVVDVKLINAGFDVVLPTMRKRMIEAVQDDSRKKRDIAQESTSSSDSD